MTGIDELIGQREAISQRVVEQTASPAIGLARRQAMSVADRLAHPDADGATVERVLELAKRAA